MKNNNNKMIEFIIKTAESKYKWMKISKQNNQRYMIEDTRFTPYSVYKHGLTKDELLEELKPYLLSDLKS